MRVAVLKRELGQPREPGIVRGMLLERILSEAISEGAGVVVLETGAPAMLISPVSSRPTGVPLAGDELFEAVSSLLDEAQQVDLAVGSVVQTTRAAAGTVWNFVIEPRVDGLWVRCGRDDMPSSDGLPAIELDPAVGGTPGHYDPLPSPPSIEYGDDPFAPPVGFREGITSGDDVELGLELEAPLGALPATSSFGGAPSPESSDSRFVRSAEPPGVVDRGFNTDFTDDDEGPIGAPQFPPPPPFAGPPRSAAAPTGAAASPAPAQPFAPPPAAAAPPFVAPPFAGGPVAVGAPPPFAAGGPVGAAGYAAPASPPWAPQQVPPPPMMGSAPFVPSPPPTSGSVPMSSSIGSVLKDAPPPSRDPFEDDEVSFSEVSASVAAIPPVDVGPTAPPSAPTVQIPAASGVSAQPAVAPISVAASRSKTAGPAAPPMATEGHRAPSVLASAPSGPPASAPSAASVDAERSGVRATIVSWRPVRSAESPGSLVEEVGNGSVCFVLGGGAVALLGTSGVLVYVEGDDPKHAAEDTHGRAPGSWIVLAVDDPSPWLGWILRRLEEGHRVLVDTHARSPEGARRTLLGLDAGPRADEWLAAHAVCALREESGSWSLERRLEAREG